MPIWNQKNGPMLVNIFVAFASVAIWSSIPLTIRLLTTMKQRHGLYFYAILTCTWGLCVRQIGYLLQYLVHDAPWWLCNILSQCGWICMVTGFAVVLYSRLNIILESVRFRRAILYCIIFNGVVFHTTMTVLSVGATAIVRTGTPHQKAFLARSSWKKVFNSMERTQIIVFALQETVISFFYMHAAFRYLKSQFARKDKTRETMFLLLFVQVIIMLVDVALIVMDFAGLLQMKGFILSFSYCLKLELEFVVLNQLVELSRMGVAGIQSFSLAVMSKKGGNVEEGGGMGVPTKTGVQMDVRQGTPASSEPESVKSGKRRASLEFITTAE
ncbi:hypothetical protein BDV96DRAFT_672399 [Lophiotrema nucula]|uniref:DUF7703 domain-containing protein n=1 Tax=Lophiotrema nucula TaxID=690887 RepID=A0A6A5YMS2_9PLEO|nr:hypothetical protein BDV96DRAFT_672399 [Lophiotrema nucula]